MEKRTILFVTADPKNMERLRLGAELREVQEVLENSENRDFFNIQISSSSTFANLLKYLREHQPAIVHFVGHGQGEKGLCFEDEDGKKKLIDNEAIEEAFKLAQPHVEFVFLNACHSSIQAERIVKHIPYAIGMSAEILDKTATAFATQFYQHYIAEPNIPEAFKWAFLSMTGSDQDNHKNIVLSKKDKPHETEVESISKGPEQPPIKEPEVEPISEPPKPPPPELPPKKITPFEPLLVAPPSAPLADRHCFEVEACLESHWGFSGVQRLRSKQALKHELQIVDTNFIYLYARVEEEQIVLGTTANGATEKLSLQEFAQYLQFKGQMPVVFLVLCGDIKPEAIPAAFKNQVSYLWLLILPRYNERYAAELSNISCRLIANIAQQSDINQAIQQLEHAKYSIQTDSFGATPLQLSVDAESQRTEQQFRAALLRILLGRQDIKSLISDEIRRHADNTHIPLLYSIVGNQHSCIFELPQQIKYWAQPSLKTSGTHIMNIPLHVDIYEPEDQTAIDEYELRYQFNNAQDQSFSHQTMQEVIPQLLEEHLKVHQDRAIVFHWNLSIHTQTTPLNAVLQQCLAAWHATLTDIFNHAMREDVVILQALLIQVKGTDDLTKLHKQLQDQLYKLNQQTGLFRFIRIRQPLDSLEPFEINDFFKDKDNRAWYDYFRFKPCGIDVEALAQWVCDETQGEFENVVKTLWEEQQYHYKKFRQEMTHEQV